MGKIEKFKLQDGSYTDAEIVEVNQSSEHWNQYLLEDGTVVKLKLVVVKVVRLINQYDQAGNPVYFVNSQNIVSVDCPSNLKRTK